MKVDNKVNSNVSQLQELATQKTQDARKSKQSLLENLGSKDVKQDSVRVALSERAQDMKKATDVAKNAPDVNLDKVKKFQELIDSGNYKVDSKKVADKLVDEHLMSAAMTEEE
jgi:negative regulator of flagellin synthesis FlgM